MTEQARTVLDVGSIVGESAIWDERAQALFWVDIIAKKIHRYEPESGRHSNWSAPDFVSSIGLRQDGGFIVGLMKEIALWDDGGRFEPFASIESDRPANRLNEGVVGPDGALWVGTMTNNIDIDGSPKDIEAATGRLYRVMADGRVTRLSEDRFGITNTLVWSGDRLITADTLANEIYSYRIVDGERLADRTTILSGFERGLPDGSCMDEEGYVWNCRVVGGQCLIRMDPSGRIDRIVELPCSWPTSCAFGGPDLDILFVTSARFTMDDEHLLANPQEGHLFSVRPGVRGRPAHRFG